MPVYTKRLRREPPGNQCVKLWKLSSWLEKWNMSWRNICSNISKPTLEKCAGSVIFEIYCRYLNKCNYITLTKVRALLSVFFTYNAVGIVKAYIFFLRFTLTNCFASVGIYQGRRHQGAGGSPVTHHFMEQKFFFKVKSEKTKLLLVNSTWKFSLYIE